MIGSRSSSSSAGLAVDADVEDALRLVRTDSVAVMLYGSRARGTDRPDSDIDILCLVKRSPGTVTVGNVSINYYTPSDLAHLAGQGSLFILHLRDEGVLISDPCGTLDRILNSYAARLDYTTLREDLKVVLDALGATDRDRYEQGLRRVGIWAVRSAVYIVCAEQQNFSFDTESACRRASVPELWSVLRQGSDVDLDQLRELGLRVLDVKPETSQCDLATMALRSWDSEPAAAKVLESVIAGASQIEYTQLTLPAI